MSNSSSQVDFVAIHLPAISNVPFEKESFIIAGEVRYSNVIFIALLVSMRYTSMLPAELEAEQCTSSHEFLEAAKAQHQLN